MHADCLSHTDPRDLLHLYARRKRHRPQVINDPRPALVSPISTNSRAATHLIPFKYSLEL